MKKNMFSFKFTKKRVIRALVLILVFVIIAVVVSLVFKNLKNSDTYEKEVEVYVEADEKQTIGIKKYDLDKDGTDDYITLLGTPTYDNTNSTVEQYSSLEVAYLNGSTSEVIRYSIDKSFASDVSLSICEDKDSEYIVISDSSSGNMVMLKLVDDKFTDIISDSFGDNFTGYTIDMEFDEDNSNILKVKLDNYSKSYLPKDSNTYTLDFSNEGVDLANYRQTYNLDKFSRAELSDIDGDGELELTTYQYLLYLYKDDEDEESTDTLGYVALIFDYKDGKYEFQEVDVEI